MAASANALARTVDPCIGLIPDCEVSQLPQLRLERNVTIVGGHVVRRREECISMSDEDSLEHACRLFKDFQKLYRAESLALTTGTLRKEYFTKVLRGQALDRWVPIRDNYGNAAADFRNAINEWLLQYTEVSEYEDQLQYLRTVKKPFRLTVKQLASRNAMINTLLSMHPGNPNRDNNPFTDNALKRIIYGQMLPQWQNNFNVQRADDLDNNAYTLRQLVRFFSNQEAAHNGRYDRSQGRGGRGGRGGLRRSHGGAGRGGYARRSGYSAARQGSPSGYHPYAYGGSPGYNDRRSLPAGG